VLLHDRLKYAVEPVVGDRNQIWWHSESRDSMHSCSYDRMCHAVKCGHWKCVNFGCSVVKMFTLDVDTGLHMCIVAQL